MPSDASITALLETMRADMRQRDRAVDAQLTKIHDLVNSQLTEAVNRFRDALQTIEELKARLGETTTPKLFPTVTPSVHSLDFDPAAHAARQAELEAFIEAAKTMALTVVEQAERLSALIVERRARADNESQAERRRIFPHDRPD